MKSANREIQNENLFPTAGFELGTSLNVALLDEISMEHVNIDRFLPECDIKIYLYRALSGRYSKTIRRVFLSCNIYIVLLFDLF